MEDELPSQKTPFEHCFVAREEKKGIAPCRWRFFLEEVDILPINASKSRRAESEGAANSTGSHCKPAGGGVQSGNTDEVCARKRNVVRAHSLFPGFQGCSVPWLVCVWTTKTRMCFCIYAHTHRNECVRTRTVPPNRTPNHTILKWTWYFRCGRSSAPLRWSRRKFPNVSVARPECPNGTVQWVLV